MSRIISFHAEGFKRIKVIDIRPTSRLVKITGPNGSGKTSVLDAILVALKGLSSFRGQSQPINVDAQHAMIKLDLGDYIVTRIFRRPKAGGKSQEITTEVRVENADGFRAPEPQKMLDGLISALAFDPLEFGRMDDKGQRDTMRRLVSGFNFETNIQARKEAFDLRTIINKQAKDADALAAAVKLPDDIATDAQPVDEAALAQQMADASRINGDIERKRGNRERVRDRINTIEQQAVSLTDGLEGRLAEINKAADRMVEDIEQQIARLQGKLIVAEAGRDRDLVAARNANAAEIEVARDEAQKLRESLEAAGPLADPVDVQEIMAAMTDARRINASIRVVEEHATKLERAKALHAQADVLTARIDQLDKEKLDAIAAAKLPVDGLTIGEDGMFLNGLPFSQASDAQRLRTSCAIAMALNSKLRVLRVRDGSLLDDDGLALLEQMAVDNDYDIWIERVETDAKSGFVLEDGMIRGAAAVEEKQPESA